MDSSNVYIRIILSHLAMLALVLTSWKASSFSFLEASKLLKAYFISLWERFPSEDRSYAKPAHRFVLEACKHELAMQEKQALQRMLSITWYTT